MTEKTTPTPHVRGAWKTLRNADGLTFAQGYECSCGVIGCQEAKEAIPVSITEQESLARYKQRAGLTDAQAQACALFAVLSEFFEDAIQRVQRMKKCPIGRQTDERH